MNEIEHEVQPTAFDLEQRELRNEQNRLDYENYQQTLLAVINFLYFTANFMDLSFVHKIWDGEGLGQHMQAKMDGICQKYAALGYLPSAAIIDFFFLLSRNHQEKFVAWVQFNYHFSSDHK